VTEKLELGLDEAVSSDDVEDAARAAAFRLVNLVPAGAAHPAQAIFTRDGGATVLYFLEGGASERRLVIAGAGTERAAADLRQAFQRGCPPDGGGAGPGGGGEADPPHGGA
jgi:hypothetical protein